VLEKPSRANGRQTVNAYQTDFFKIPLDILAKFVVFGGQ